MTDIIVYRNPVEKMIWDALMGNGTGNGLFVPIIGGLVVFFILVYIPLNFYEGHLRRLYGRIFKNADREERSEGVMKIVFTIAGFAGASVGYWLY